MRIDRSDPADEPGDTHVARRTAELQKRLEATASEPADPEELLSAAQGVIETLPV